MEFNEASLQWATGWDNEERGRCGWSSYRSSVRNCPPPILLGHILLERRLALKRAATPDSLEYFYAPAEAEFPDSPELKEASISDI